MSATPLLQVRGLGKDYPGEKTSLFKPRKQHCVVDGVSFDLYPGQTLGLVGESGSGKSTTGRMLMRLVKASRGQVLLDGVDLLKLPSRQFAALRAQIQMIFQDPGASFNPAYSIGQSLHEPLHIHQPELGQAERQARVEELLEQVGLRASHASRLPHEFSGGQRQRIAIARALAMQPRIIVADEPVSALDVSVQAQVLNLMQQIKRSHQVAYIFIAHDLAVVRHMSDQVAVMHRGRIVERGDCDQLYARPLHPYTRLLLDSVPHMRRQASVVPRVAQHAASPGPEACRFFTACPQRSALCAQQAPATKEVESGHFVACHHY